MGGAFNLTLAPHSTPQPWRGYGTLRGRGWGVNRCAGLAPPLAGDLAVSSLTTHYGMGSREFLESLPRTGIRGIVGRMPITFGLIFLSSPPLRSSALTSQIDEISTCPSG